MSEPEQTILWIPAIGEFSKWQQFTGNDQVTKTQFDDFNSEAITAAQADENEVIKISWSVDRMKNELLLAGLENSAHNRAVVMTAYMEQ